jgi:hypothetical protein
MEGIKGIWSLQHSSSSAAACEAGGVFDKYLVQAYTWETRVLWIDEDDEMGECEIPGFLSQTTSLFCGCMSARGGEAHFVQVTPGSVRLVSASSGELIQELKYEKKIMVAEGNNNQVSQC